MKKNFVNTVTERRRDNSKAHNALGCCDCLNIFLFRYQYTHSIGVVLRTVHLLTNFLTNLYLLTTYLYFCYATK